MCLSSCACERVTSRQTRKVPITTVNLPLPPGQGGADFHGHKFASCLGSLRPLKTWASRLEFPCVGARGGGVEECSFSTPEPAPPTVGSLLSSLTCPYRAKNLNSAPSTAVQERDQGRGQRMDLGLNLGLPDSLQEWKRWQMRSLFNGCPSFGSVMLDRTFATTFPRLLCHLAFHWTLSTARPGRRLEGGRRGEKVLPSSCMLFLSVQPSRPSLQLPSAPSSSPPVPAQKSPQKLSSAPPV